MFFDRLENLKNYGSSEQWKEIVTQFIREYPGCADKAEGSYPLCHGAFYNIMQADLKEDNVYEYHKKYIDVHCTLSGVEKIDGAFFFLFSGTGNYSEEKDAGFFHDTAEKNCTFYVAPGDCAVFFAYEAHKTLLRDDRGGGSATLKKAIVKIPVEYWEKA